MKEKGCCQRLRVRGSVGFHARVDRHCRRRMTLGDVHFVPAFRESSDPAKWLGIRQRELGKSYELHSSQYGWSADETRSNPLKRNSLRPFTRNVWVALFLYLLVEGRREKPLSSPVFSTRSPCRTRLERFRLFRSLELRLERWWPSVSCRPLPINPALLFVDWLVVVARCHPCSQRWHIIREGNI